MRACLLPCLLLAAACGVATPEPLPIRGAAPSAIAVWPLLTPDFQAASELFLPPLERALQQRGYRVVPATVARELLAECKAAQPQDAPAEVARLLAVDAVLHLVVREFAATGSRPLQDAHWDVEWRLVAVPGGTVTWSWANRGAWAPRVGDFGDPHRPLDAERDVVPIGGNRDIIYRDARELATALHLAAMAHLQGRAR